jgi:hypothetical protein|tara:strand:- start:36 stop:926 length:891 start_codon:yes stop_codon:yes gene_type:complete
MFVYWGAKATGKAELMTTTLVNNLSVGKFFRNSIKIKSNTVHIKTGDDWHISVDDDTFAKESDKSKLAVFPGKFEISNEGVNKHILTEKNPQIDYTYQFNQVIDQKIYDDAIKFRGNPYKFPCNLKSIGFDKCFMIMEMNAVMKHKLVVRQVLKFPHKHVMPYRTYETPEHLVHRLHQFNPINDGRYDNVFDMYEKSKEDCWKYISHFDTENRDLEAILVDSGVEYSYFALDHKDTYSDVFGLEVSLKQGLTKPKYNLEDEETRKRYNKALDICQEYLDVTGITDSRLEFRSKDGI